MVVSYKRKRSITTSAKRTATPRVKAYRRRTPTGKMMRFNVSRTRYKKAKAVSSLLRNVMETKLLGIIPVNEEAPAATLLGGLVYRTAHILGPTVPSAWGTAGTDFTVLDGITTNPGTGPSDRIGQSVYFKKTTLTVQIDMTENADPTPSPPLEFRMIVAKARRPVMPSGVTRDPKNALFLTTVGDEFGHNTGGTDGTDLMVQPLNKRMFTIFCDKHFTMSNPLSPGAVGGIYSGYYPCMKRVRLDLPHYRKAEFQGAAATTPEDYDFVYLMYIYARSLDKDQKASNWEVNIRGTTSYVDN